MLICHLPCVFLPELYMWLSAVMCVYRFRMGISMTPYTFGCRHPKQMIIFYLVRECIITLEHTQFPRNIWCICSDFYFKLLAFAFILVVFVVCCYSFIYDISGRKTYEAMIKYGHLYVTNLMAYLNCVCAVCFTLLMVLHDYMHELYEFG